jgi:diguanylate cyclase (GGDEF)-like protein/PAS domain S-box-containing protein
MRGRGPLVAFVAGMAVLAAAYFPVATSTTGTVLWGAFGVLSAGAIAVGVRINKPARPGPWLLLAAGVLLQAAGDCAARLIGGDGSVAERVPLPIHLLYVGMFVCVFTGLLQLARSGVASRDRAGLLDAITLTLGVGLVCWVYLVMPSVHAQLSVLDGLLAAAYPAGQLVLISLMVWLLLGMRNTPSLWLLALGWFSLAAGVLWYLTALLHGGEWQVGTVADLGWIVFQTAWGAAALHPSMTHLTDSRPRSPEQLTVPRLVLLAWCSLIPSQLLIGMAIRGTLRSALVIGAAGAFMVVLVLARLTGALRRQAYVLGRERRLREAGATLAEAADADAVHRAVTEAVTRLLPPGARCLSRLDLTAPAPERAVLGDPSRLAPDWPQSHTMLALLACPMELPDTAAEVEDGGGRLLVAADEDVLLRAQETLEILALQAGTVLTRIRLAEEVNQRNSEAYFRALVQHAADVVLIVDLDGKIRYHNPAAVRLFGELDGRPAVELVVREQRATARETFGHLLNSELTQPETDWMVDTPIGARHVEASVRDLRADPAVAGFIVVLRDVTEDRRIERELTHRAYHDPLTGLANRALFDDEVARAAQRDQPVGVLLVDLDDFKRVNDTFGHLAGDELLSAIASRLTAAAGEAGIAARLGGDEFAILVDHSSLGLVDMIAANVVDALGEPVRAAGHEVDVSVSVGVATSDVSPGERLMHDADRALYTAKAAGGRRWHRHEPPQ